MSAPFPSLIDRLCAALVRAERSHRARQELRRMDDRMLSDIGIGRAEAEAHARFWRSPSGARTRS